MFVFFSAAGADVRVGPSNAIYVDVAGDDATGTRGDAALPFLTIAGAFAVAQSGDEVLVSPGTFTGPVVLPGIANLLIRGSGSQVGGTVLTAAGGVDVVTLHTSNRSIRFEACSITGVGAGKAVVGTGITVLTNNWLSDGLVMDRVVLTVAAAATLAVDLAYASVVRFLDCVIPVGSLSLVTCSDVQFRGTRQAGSTALITWDNTDARAPIAGQNFVQLLEASSWVSAVTMTGQARLAVDAASVVSSLTGLNMTVAAGPVSPAIFFQGTVGTIDFESAAAKYLPSSALGAYTVDFSKCTVAGAFARFQTSAADLVVDMTGFVSTAAAFVLTANVRILIVALGSVIRNNIPATTYATPGATGSITPPFLKGLTSIAAGGAVAKTWADLGYTALIRVGTAVFNANVTSNVAGADAVVPVAGKAVTGLTITAAAVGGNTAANVGVTF